MKFMELLDEELEVPKNVTIFQMPLRVGDVVNGAFNPDKKIVISANSTEDFMKKLDATLRELREPMIDSKLRSILVDKLSDLEMEYHSKMLAVKQALKDQRYN